MNLPVIVEVCIGSLADLEAARAAGADRVELCGALELGGLTPSLGLVELALAASTLPVVAMVRPRAGGFCYDRAEFQVMLRDAERMIDLGVSGLAFGVLDRHSRIDASRSRELVAVAGQAAAVFHRAFDIVADQQAALEELVDVGVTRVLSSGGRPSALEGAGALRRLVEHAQHRMEIMAGGGVTADNVGHILELTGCRQVHIGAAAPRDDGAPSAAALELCDRRCLEGGRYRAVVPQAAAAAARAARVAAAGAPPADRP
ncbi:MAG: copper homeostasis protein CutC [Planctomycetota bacterium]|nr:MAG: copper homeostasis protein CutC [Planctomycetota bacterium]